MTRPTPETLAAIEALARKATPLRVYVAHPIGADDDGRPARIQAGIDAGTDLLRAGLYPFVPGLWAAAMRDDKLTADMLCDYESWMQYDFAWIGVCDALLRVAGTSPGADREVKFAIERGIPVFYSVAEVVAHANR